MIGTLQETHGKSSQRTEPAASSLGYSPLGFGNGVEVPKIIRVMRPF